MTSDRAMLARALTLLREHGTNTDGVLVVTDPWTILVTAEMDRDAVAALMAQKCLVGIGQMRFRIMRETLPEPKTPPVLPSVAATEMVTARPSPQQMQRAVLLVLDAENAYHTHRDAGLPFHPATIRDAAREVGEIAFAFAYGNIEAIPARVREDLTMSGFPLVHCQRLRDSNGGKDTVDEHIQDLVRRFLTHSAVDSVVFVSDDRNFAPILRGVVDAGKRLVRLTLRGESMLDQIGEVRRLPHGESVAPAPNGKRWDPDVIIDDLRDLPTLPPGDWPAMLQRIRLRAPFVQHFLRIAVRAYLGTWGRAPLSFLGLVELVDSCVRQEDRPHISKDDLHRTLSALVDIGVIRKFTRSYGKDGERPRYEPNWGHPFCAAAIADISKEQEGTGRRSWSRRMQQRREVANGTPTSTDTEASGRTRKRRTQRRHGRERTREDDRGPIPPSVA
ncbi:MAG: NYN domain-containing protein [bacterium]|nr:NYN domain-containing protein [bacterium]